MKKILIAFSILICMACIAISVYVGYHYFFRTKSIEINKEDFPIIGIDISEHTGRVDFNKAKEQNIRFVFIKASEGEDYQSDHFDFNYYNAKANKVAVSAYHFFRFNKSGVIQAKNFLSAIKGKVMDLPLVLDIEEWGNSNSKSRKQVVLEIKSFISELKNNGFHRLILYVNGNSYEKYIKGEGFLEQEIWICTFRPKPDIEDDWIFWQYSHCGKIEGTSNEVDFNAFNGNEIDWELYLNRDPRK